MDGHKEKLSDNIYNYIKLNEVRRILINEPQLCILFEMLCLHIKTTIDDKKDKDKEKGRLIRSVS